MTAPEHLAEPPDEFDPASTNEALDIAVLGRMGTTDEADRVSRTGGYVPEDGYWQPQCGEAKRYLEKKPNRFPRCAKNHQERWLPC